MKSRKPWPFCETPEEKCTMNYCDENGCQNRKGNSVDDNDLVAVVSDSFTDNLSCALCGYMCNNPHHANNWFDTKKTGIDR